MVGVWRGRGMASVNQTRLHCVDQMGKTHSKPLVARHALCESACRSSRGMRLYFSQKQQIFAAFYMEKMYFLHLILRALIIFNSFYLL